MVAHLYCTCFDKEEIPTSLSKNCINYLRNQLLYKGLLISDDMYMNGVRKFGDIDACLKGIDAGLNMFIYRDSSLKTLNLLSQIFNIVKNDKVLTEKVNRSYEKIINLKNLKK
jgi:beta-N-acetylhexosaminidase